MYIYIYVYIYIYRVHINKTWLPKNKNSNILSYMLTFTIVITKPIIS